MFFCELEAKVEVLSIDFPFLLLRIRDSINTVHPALISDAVIVFVRTNSFLSSVKCVTTNKLPKCPSPTGGNLFWSSFLCLIWRHGEQGWFVFSAKMDFVTNGVRS